MLTSLVFLIDVILIHVARHVHFGIIFFFDDIIVVRVLRVKYFLLVPQLLKTLYIGGWDGDILLVQLVALLDSL